jgi:hypothetical protein
LKRSGFSIFVADTVVNNTDPSFKKSGAFDPEEISIAVDPKNTDRIVITAISGGPDATVMQWQSRDGGVTWNKELTINSPQASGALDQEDLGSNPSRIMKVIDSKSLERDAGGKPVSATSDFGQFHGVTGAFLSAPAANITRATSRGTPPVPSIPAIGWRAIRVPARSTVPAPEKCRSRRFTEY